MPFFSRKPKPTPAPEPVAEVGTAGWDAITGVFNLAYPDQEPKHYGVLVPYRLGGPDPLEGISIYRAVDPIPHWHFVTYGYSNLYGDLTKDEERGGAEDSGYGIEMTLRLADPAAAEPDSEAPTWVLNLLQNIARYVFKTGNVILPGHYLNANGPIALDTGTRLTALAFTLDPISDPIRTPYGRVQFVQAVGITDAELDDITGWNTAGVLELIAQVYPGGLTILDRAGLDQYPELQVQVEQGRIRDGSSISHINVDTISVAEVGSELKVQLHARTAHQFLAGAAARIPYGRDFTIFGPTQVLRLVPEDDAATPTREFGRPVTTLGITAAGAAELTTVEVAPGERRLAAVPGVIWAIDNS